MNVFNLLEAHEGCIVKASRVRFSSPQYFAAGPLNFHPHSAFAAGPLTFHLLTTFAAGALNWVVTYNIGGNMLQHPSCQEGLQYTE